MLQILSAATIAATHHATTGSHGGHLSPVYFAIAIVIFLVIWFVFSSIVFFIMSCCGERDAKENYKGCLVSVTVLTLGITVVCEAVLSVAAAAGYLPWV